MLVNTVLCVVHTAHYHTATGWRAETQSGAMYIRVTFVGLVLCHARFSHKAVTVSVHERHSVIRVGVEDILRRVRSHAHGPRCQLWGVC